MTEPEQPEEPQLTRKQLRQIRNTAATQIIVPGTPAPASSPEDPGSDAAPDAPADSDADSEGPEDTTPESPDAESDVVESAVEPPAPLPRAAVPVDIAPAPIADTAVDLGVSPLTRRQARQQERIRTASVPVITPDVAAGHLGTAGAAPEVVETGAEPAVESDPSVEAQPSADPEPRATLAPSFGSELLTGEPADAPVPPSFDQLLSRGTSTSGSGTAANALILSQTPDGALMGPVAATGEVLITGTFALPEGLGSQGHAPGTADGREVDAVLVDGELPAHSSPTPIAASAAISTVKSTGDIIRPPAPEKGSRLMLTLAITAGVLALALVGVLILAFVTGLF